MQQVRVVNRSKYALDLVCAPTKNKAGEIEMHAPVLVPSAGEHGVPGEALIEVSHWDALKSHKGAKRYLKRGWIVAAPVADDKGGAGAKPKKNPLLDLDEGDAAELVSFTEDVSEIEGWLRVEKRAPVRAAIEKRLRMMAKG